MLIKVFLVLLNSVNLFASDYSFSIDDNLIFVSRPSTASDLVLNNCEGRKFRNKHSAPIQSNIQKKLKEVAEKTIKASGLSKIKKLRLPIGLYIGTQNINGPNMDCGVIKISAATIHKLKYENELAFIFAHEFVHYMDLHGVKDGEYLEEEFRADSWALELLHKMGYSMKGLDHLFWKLTACKDGVDDRETECKIRREKIQIKISDLEKLEKNLTKQKLIPLNFDLKDYQIYLRNPHYSWFHILQK